MSAMHPISASATSARESARQSDGKFGTQEHPAQTDPLVGLDLARYMENPDYYQRVIDQTSLKVARNILPGAHSDDWDDVAQTTALGLLEDLQRGVVMETGAGLVYVKARVHALSARNGGNQSRYDTVALRELDERVNKMYPHGATPKQVADIGRAMMSEAKAGRGGRMPSSEFWLLYRQGRREIPLDLSSQASDSQDMSDGIEQGGMRASLARRASVDWAEELFHDPVADDATSITDAEDRYGPAAVLRAWDLRSKELDIKRDYVEGGGSRTANQMVGLNRLSAMALCSINDLPMPTLGGLSRSATHAARRAVQSDWDDTIHQAIHHLNDDGPANVQALYSPWGGQLTRQQKIKLLGLLHDGSSTRLPQPEQFWLSCSQVADSTHARSIKAMIDKYATDRRDSEEFWWSDDKRDGVVAKAQATKAARRESGQETDRETEAGTGLD